MGSARSLGCLDWGFNVTFALGVAAAGLLPVALAGAARGLLPPRQAPSAQASPELDQSPPRALTSTSTFLLLSDAAGPSRFRRGPPRYTFSGPGSRHTVPRNAGPTSKGPWNTGHRDTGPRTTGPETKAPGPMVPPTQVLGPQGPGPRPRDRLKLNSLNKSKAKIKPSQARLIIGYS